MTRLRAALRPTNAEPPAPDLYGVLEFDGIRWKLEAIYDCPNKLALRVLHQHRIIGSGEVDDWCLTEVITYGVPWVVKGHPQRDGHWLTEWREARELPKWRKAA